MSDIDNVMTLSQILHGDSLEILATLPDNSVDAIVTDPPAGIAFMSKSWDTDKGGRDSWIAWLASVMTEAWRVLKPGGHGLIWALPRTSHWTALALEDAGFEIRDSIYHLYSKQEMYQDFLSSLDDKQKLMFERLIEQDPMMLHIFGSGFPKSLDVSKAIDKYFDVEREVVCMYDSRGKSDVLLSGKRYGETTITAPATPAAQQYAGYGSALKPSCEVWWLIRKPLSEKSIAANVLRWGTGALNIDGCRIPGEDTTTRHNSSSSSYMTQSIGSIQPKQDTYITGSNNGRWPSHLVMSHSLWCTPDACTEDCPVRVMDEQSGITSSHGGGHVTRTHFNTPAKNHPPIPKGDSGGASRYFARFYYTSKASQAERSAGCEALPIHAAGKNQSSFDGGKLLTGSGNERSNYIQNHHPTVKPVSLMSYLVRMITPPDGIVLDPFGGTGTTALACIQENKSFIIVEKEQEYIDIIHARVAHAYRQKEIVS